MKKAVCVLALAATAAWGDTAPRRTVNEGKRIVLLHSRMEKARKELAYRERQADKARAKVQAAEHAFRSAMEHGQFLKDHNTLAKPKKGSGWGADWHGVWK